MYDQSAIKPSHEGTIYMTKLQQKGVLLPGQNSGGEEYAKRQNQYIWSQACALGTPKAVGTHN